MKLNRPFFGLCKYSYLYAQYIAQRNSPAFIITGEGHDRHGQLSCEIDKFSALGDVAIIGNLDSRVGSQQEAHYGVDTECHNTDIATQMYVNLRTSRELHTNAHGCKLLQLMANHDMLLANDRFSVDISGNFTCCHYNGSSVVDIFIVQRDRIPLLSYFNVKDFDWYSDHAVISACIAVDVNRATPLPADWKRVNNLFQNWYDNTKNEFVRKLSDPIISDKLKTFRMSVKLDIRS